MTTKDVLDAVCALSSKLEMHESQIQVLRDRRNRLYEQAQAKLRKVDEADQLLNKLDQEQRGFTSSKVDEFLHPFADAFLELFPGCTRTLHRYFEPNIVFSITITDRNSGDLDRPVAFGKFVFDMVSRKLVMVDYDNPKKRSSRPSDLASDYEVIAITSEADLAEIAAKMRTWNGWYW